jgi:signal transduction histidine kinase
MNKASAMRSESISADPGHRFALLQAGLDHIGQGFTIIDTDLKLVGWNRRFFTLLDFPMSMARYGTPFADFMRFNALRGEYGPGDVEELVAERVRMAASFQPHYFERSRPDGTVIAVRGEPLPDLGFVTTYADITEQRYYERLIREQNEELDRRVRERTSELEFANADLLRANAARERMAQALLHAQKMEAVGQLTGGLAHDFNNLLTIIVGNLSALQERCGKHAEVLEFAEPAYQASLRGVDLVRRLLAFARQQPLEPRPIDAGKLVGDFIRLLLRSLPEIIGITLDEPEQPLFTLADANQLEGALLNLALNARDAMPRGGQLRFVVTSMTPTEEQALAYQVPPGKYVAFRVADSGMGMDAETQARVFEPFFTGKEFGKGSGLGLSMVYGFVRQSGGGIRIDSQPDCGTTVTLLLPSCDAPVVAAERPFVETPPKLTSGRLILLVEDEDEVRKIICRQLVELGYLVVEASTGDEASVMLDTIPGISVLVSDVVMPGGMGGWALAKHVKARHPAIGIILISGYAEGLEGTEAERLDLPLLRKPFSKDEIAAAIEAAP